MSTTQAMKPAAEKSGGWPDYAAVWRWHFYAGVFCIPFVIVLSITGTISLFRPQIEAWQERQYDRLAMNGQTSLKLSQQIESAVASVRDGKFVSVEQPTITDSPTEFASATRVIVDQNGSQVRVYVDPRNANVLGSVVENERFIRVVRRIHGELLLGKRGSYLVELAASWTIVMIVTGMVLWLPKKFRFAGVLYPRLNRRGKTFWKDVHSVGGFWTSSLIVFLIATGLPWSLFWGDYFKSVRRVTGTAQSAEHWDNGSSKDEHANHAMKSASKRIASGGPSWRKAAPDPSSYDPSLVNQVALFAQSLDFVPPVTLSPPSDKSTVWAIKSETANRPHQQTLHYDAAAQSVVGHETFSDRHWVDQVVGQGIALHEGQRFGLLNQLIALVATSGLVMLSVTGLILWWRRRDSIGLSPPAMMAASGRPTERLSRSRFIVIASLGLLLAVYLPLFGFSLAVVLVLDWLVFSRVEPLAIWLGRKSLAKASASFLAIVLVTSGCSRSPEPVTGGTKGTLTSGGVLLSQMQINVFDSANEPIGRGYLASDGTFELINEARTDPLVLTTGTFRFTIESLGAEVVIPEEFTDPRKTPLVIEYQSGSQLKLEMKRMKGV